MSFKLVVEVDVVYMENTKHCVESLVITCYVCFFVTGGSPPHSDNASWLCVTVTIKTTNYIIRVSDTLPYLLSGEPDYFGRNKISSGGDLSHYSSASLY